MNEHACQQCDQSVPNWAQACQTCGTYLIGRDCICPPHDTPWSGSITDNGGIQLHIYGAPVDAECPVHDPVNAICDAPASATSQPAQPITPGSPT